MQIELWPIDRLKPYENSPRINDGAVDAVVAWPSLLTQLATASNKVAKPRPGEQCKMQSEN